MGRLAPPKAEEWPSGFPPEADREGAASPRRKAEGCQSGRTGRTRNAVSRLAGSEVRILHPPLSYGVEKKPWGRKALVGLPC